MALPFWDPGATPWDNTAQLRTEWNTFYVDGEPWPGIAWVTSTRHQGVDLKESPGSDGATLTNCGSKPAEVAVRVQLWTPEHLASWARIVPTMEARPGHPRTTPFSAGHPSLTMHRITRLWLKSVSMLAPGPVPGVFETVVTFYEWLPRNRKAQGVLTPVKATAAGGETGPQAFPLAKPSEHEAGPRK